MWNEQTVTGWHNGVGDLVESSPSDNSMSTLAAPLNKVRDEVCFQKCQSAPAVQRGETSGQKTIRCDKHCTKMVSQLPPTMGATPDIIATVTQNNTKFNLKQYQIPLIIGGVVILSYVGYRIFKK